jgi:hypothetical protein
MRTQIRKRSAALVVGLVAPGGALAPVEQARPTTTPGAPAQQVAR